MSEVSVISRMPYIPIGLDLLMSAKHKSTEKIDYLIDTAYERETKKRLKALSDSSEYSVNIPTWILLSKFLETREKYLIVYFLAGNIINLLINNRKKLDSLNTDQLNMQAIKSSATSSRKIASSNKEGATVFRNTINNLIRSKHIGKWDKSESTTIYGINMSQLSKDYSHQFPSIPRPLNTKKDSIHPYHLPHSWITKNTPK